MTSLRTWLGKHDARAQLSLVLVGLLRDRLALHKNRSLGSRIHTRVNFGEAISADTAEYASS